MAQVSSRIDGGRIVAKRFTFLGEFTVREPVPARKSGSSVAKSTKG